VIKTRDIEIIKVYIDFDANNSSDFVECVRSVINHTSQVVQFIPLDHGMINNLIRAPITETDINYSMFLIPSLNSLTGFALYLNSGIRLDYDITELWAWRSMAYDIQFFDCDVTDSKMALWNCNGYPHRKLNDDVLYRADADKLKSLDWLNQERIDYIKL
jgi:hypothetical protein